MDVPGGAEEPCDGGDECSGKCRNLGCGRKSQVSLPRDDRRVWLRISSENEEAIVGTFPLAESGL